MTLKRTSYISSVMRKCSLNKRLKKYFKTSEVKTKCTAITCIKLSTYFSKWLNNIDVEIR